MAARAPLFARTDQSEQSPIHLALTLNDRSHSLFINTCFIVQCSCIHNHVESQLHLEFSQIPNQDHKKIEGSKKKPMIMFTTASSARFDRSTLMMREFQGEIAATEPYI